MSKGVGHLDAKDMVKKNPGGNKVKKSRGNTVKKSSGGIRLKNPEGIKLKKSRGKLVKQGAVLTPRPEVMHM